MDYYAIGQRIRRIRKAKGLSQEQLAEKVGISVTHMCHIETANTKLSLPVFVTLTEVLEVQADTLLSDVSRESVDSAIARLSTLLEGCNTRQLQFIEAIIKVTKQSLNTYYDE